LENRETPAKYLDFILQKSIDDLKRDSKIRLDFDAVNMYFNYVKKAKDTLKAVYTLMHIAKMKDTAVYLTFVLKKIKEGAVNFDTLDENAREDCEYIKGELLKNFSLSVEAGDEPELKIPEVSGSGLSEMIKENKFKVKSDDDASIAEEFSVKEFYDEQEEISGEGEEENSKMASEEISIEASSETSFDNDTDDEDDEAIKMNFGDEDFELISNSEEGEEGFEILNGTETLKKTEYSDIQQESKIENDTGSDDIPEYTGEIEGEGFVIKKTIAQDEIKEEQLEQEIPEELPSEDIAAQENPEADSEEYEEGYIESEVIIEETVETVLIEEKEEAADEPLEETPEEEPEDLIEELSSTPQPEVSEQYKDYESTLFEVNELLKDYFLDIESVPDGAASPDGEPVIFGKIVELCNIMRNRSDKMSFSIISNVYRNTGGIFKEYLKTNSRPNSEELEKFNRGIILVEGLIKGDDLPEADDILESLEALRKSFTDVVVETENTSDDETSSHKAEKAEASSEIGSGQDAVNEEEYKENIKPPVSLREKYSNAELRESFKQLKLQIQDLEQTFQSLDDIEGEYQNYEGLRTLSATFLNLKEIIRRAKILDLKNVAKLSEAGYVFIKFIQNYRMNPFDEDIREIFKYIIYNFKAAALDKPNEDLERFISYLNDPVKIFTQQNKKRN
jgi:hypothetical protein